MTHERQRGRGSPSTLTLLEYSFIIVTISRTPPALEPLNPQLHQYQLAYKEKKHYIGIEARKGLIHLYKTCAVERRKLEISTRH